MEQPAHFVEPEQTEIRSLGECKIQNPLFELSDGAPAGDYCVNDLLRVRVNSFTDCGVTETEAASFERAGPRDHIYFDSTKLRAAVVTCGGMCPGINSLVRSIVLQLHFIYGVPNIVGIRFGLQGFIPKYGHELVDLTPQEVRYIHGRGGSFLGMSRGAQPVEEVVDALDRLNIGLLFMIGGDGTLHAAKAITEEITERGLKIAVVAIPKTIDNDICFVDRTFGFQTAVEAATQAILGAHNEAEGAPNGIGLVKLMGRHAGFVAANATLALQEVNFCLIPEVDFDLEGDKGLLAMIEKRLDERGHCVVVVAEGAGQKFFSDMDLGTDASGNVKLGDIGTFLKDRINQYFRGKQREIVLKYIDPSYIVRSMPANSNDRIYVGFLGQHAVHAGLTGRTGMMVSMWNGHFVHVPVDLAITHRSRVDPGGSLWRAVRSGTGQPRLLNGD